MSTIFMFFYPQNNPHGLSFYSPNLFISPFKNEPITSPAISFMLIKACHVLMFRVDIVACFHNQKVPDLLEVLHGLVQLSLWQEDGTIQFVGFPNLLAEITERGTLGGKDCLEQWNCLLNQFPTIRKKLNCGAKRKQTYKTSNKKQTGQNQVRK